MKNRMRLLLLLAGPVMYTLSCSSPEAPPEQGGIVFRFDPPAGAVMRAAAAAVVFDSVAVAVFRGGAAITEEARQGAAIGADPIDTVEFTIPCIAEPGKRVSVELFASGVMLYHGFQESVRVQAGRRTDVIVDAYPFQVATLTVTPDVVFDGESFQLLWSSAKGASSYRVESSTSPDFSSVEWGQSPSDTFATAVLSPGSHYFRVAPQTPYATGAFAGPEFRYVLGGSGDVTITGFSAPAVIPGDLVSIFGENLDYPGTRAAVGPATMQIVAASWGELTVHMPRAGMTNFVDVSSDLGSANSPERLIALRVAYVTGGGTFAAGYTAVLAGYSGDFGNSGVVALPVTGLDSRDMNAFDIVLVAHDTGTTEASWGGGVPARAAKIKESRSNVVAIGLGGAIFLKLIGATGAQNQTTVDSDGQYYVPDGGGVFSTPHSVGSGFVKFSGKPPVTVDFAISNAPAGVNLLASTDASCLIVCNPNNRWALVDFRLTNPSGKPVIYFFWGYADDPAGLTSSGTDCLANIMNVLYTSVSPSAPDG